MRAVDTNVLVRLLTGDGGDQVPAAERFVAGGAWVSQVVLVETLWVLKSVYAVPTERLILVVGQLLDHEALVLQEPEVVAAALEVFRQRPQLGFSDCLVLAAARKAGHLPLGTFDRQLAREPGTQGL
ncbi:MAG: type II toxin-antitoxin system VapC family toxin [Thermoanaerobaculia bacterium]|nr:type II toxin-antitoxin system VapC family toxin [Thermoanaerobaculia bacterium]